MPAKPSLDQLRAQVQRIQSRSRSSEVDVKPCFSAGGTVLDAMLPHGGLRCGTIVQWIGDVSGSGASALATIAAAEIASSELSGGKPLVIFDCGKNFYPPAAISLGIPANRMVIIHKRAHHNNADMIWAIDQALRCDAVAAVWAEIGPWLNDRDARRWQLAAEAGGTVGLFVRPAAVRGRPSFADVSWHVSPHQVLSPVDSSDSDLLVPSPQYSGERVRVRGSNRQLRVQIDRCRGGIAGAVAMVEINSSSTTNRIVEIKMPTKSKHESTLVSDLAHRLANPTTAKRESARRNRHDTRRAS